jgi:hypothetical protein
VGSQASVQVNVDFGGHNILLDAANEPSIAVDATNPNRMVIGWRQFDDVLSNFRQAGWAYSTDAGRTWRFPGVLEPGVFRSDPVLAADAEGSFYYSSLSSGFSCDLFVSPNGGASWLGPTPAWGGDKQWITIDRTGGIGRGNVYQAWSIAAGCCGSNIFTRSTDGGSTFMVPLGIPSNPQWGNMEVGPDGALYVAGVDPSNRARILVAKSTSAQDPAQMPLFEVVSVVNLGGTVRVAIGPNPEGLLGQVWVGVEPATGAHPGWVYVVCSVDPAGTDPMDVKFARSTDGGLTWSSAVRLNDDAGLEWQWFATMSVAPDGRIDVVWNDTRNTGVQNESELYHTSSGDGGTTWAANQQLSPAWDSWIGWPNQMKIGDYYHMVSDRVGANLAWAATFNGEQDVWFLRIGDYDCNGNGTGDATDIAAGTSHDWNQNGIPDECEGLELSDGVFPAAAGWKLVGNVPNPFNPSTSIVFAAPATGAARLDIFDIAGRRVRTLAGLARAGRNEWTWDGTDTRGRPAPSGIYVARLAAPGFTGTHRMVLAR